MDIQKSLLSVAEQKLERQAKDLETKRTILAALPANLPIPVKMVTATAHKAKGTVWFDVTSRQDILSLLEVLAPAPLVLLRDGFVTFLPRAAFDGQPKPGQQVTAIQPFLYKVDANAKYASAHAEWWTEMNGDLVKVRAELPRDDYAIKHIRPQQTGVKEHKWQFTGLPSAEIIRWWGSDKETPPTLTLYWEDHQYSSDGKKSLLLRSGEMNFSVK